MSDEQFAAFESIIEAGRAGNWSDAESDVMRLAKAQHVTPEEAEQIRAKKPGRK